METVVLSLGGSVLIKENEPDTPYIRALEKVLLGISSKYKLYVVTGGGKIARSYIKSGRDLGAAETFLDEMGIEVTRLNASLLITALDERACHAPPRNGVPGACRMHTSTWRVSANCGATSFPRAGASANTGA